jgi:DNA-binding YbaB/EbfC family protein
VSESFDLNALLGQAMQMQEQLMAAQAEAATTEVVGRAGGGAVTITVTGGLDFRRVEIRPDAVDPDDVGMLEDLVLAALNDAMDQLGNAQQSSLGGLDMGNLPGLGDLAGGLGGLGDLAGGLGGLGGLGLSDGVEGDVALEAFLAEENPDEGDFLDEVEGDEDDGAAGSPGAASPA